MPALHWLVQFLVSRATKCDLVGAAENGCITGDGSHGVLCDGVTFRGHWQGRRKEVFSC